VWEHAGIICTGETYKTVVKLTFAKGASLKDPCGLFNSSLEGNTRRAIDFHEGDKIDEKALKALIRAAVANLLLHHPPHRIRRERLDEAARCFSGPPSRAQLRKKRKTGQGKQHVGQIPQRFGAQLAVVGHAANEDR
jgi:hypothetical protein